MGKYSDKAVAKALDKANKTVRSPRVAPRGYLHLGGYTISRSTRYDHIAAHIAADNYRFRYILVRSDSTAGIVRVYKNITTTVSEGSPNFFGGIRNTFDLVGKTGQVVYSAGTYVIYDMGSEYSITKDSMYLFCLSYAVNTPTVYYGDGGAYMGRYTTAALSLGDSISPSRNDWYDDVQVPGFTMLSAAAFDRMHFYNNV